jgi:hypothetical protein
MSTPLETTQQENISRRGSLNGKIRYLLNRIKEDTIQNHLYWNRTASDKEGVIFSTHQKPFNIRIHEQYIDISHIDGESIRIPLRDINEINDSEYLINTKVISKVEYDATGYVLFNNNTRPTLAINGVGMLKVSHDDYLRFVDLLIDGKPEPTNDVETQSLDGSVVQEIIDMLISLKHSVTKDEWSSQSTHRDFAVYKHITTTHITELSFNKNVLTGISVNTTGMFSHMVLVVHENELSAFKDNNQYLSVTHDLRSMLDEVITTAKRDEKISLLSNLFKESNK